MGMWSGCVLVCNAHHSLITSCRLGRQPNSVSVYLTWLRMYTHTLESHDFSHGEYVKDTYMNRVVSYG